MGKIRQKTNHFLKFPNPEEQFRSVELEITIIWDLVYTDGS